MSFIIKENGTKKYYIINIIFLIVILVIVLIAIFDGSFIHKEEIIKYVCNPEVNSSYFGNLLNLS